MSKIIPLVLELDETLSENEKMIGVQTIGVKEGNHNLVGYVATIKDFNADDYLSIRYGNLKSRRITDIKINAQTL